MAADEAPADGRSARGMSGESESRSGPPQTAPRVSAWKTLAAKTPLRNVQVPMALQRGPFRRYWSSQIIALAGGWMQNTAASLVVLSITSSAMMIGALNVVSALPLLFFSLFGGVVADRLDRRKIILTTQSIMGCISLTYAFLIFTDRLEYWHLLALSAFAGMVMSFDQPAAQAFVIQLVHRDDLPEALALNSASFNATRSIGPAVAGIVVGAVGMGAAFVINAVSLLAPISVLLRLKDQVKPITRPANRPSGLASLKEGMRYIRTHDDLLGLVLLSATFSFLVFPNLLVLMPLYVRDHLGGGNGWVSIMISVVGLGSLVGSIGMLRGSRLEVAAAGRLRRSMIGLTVGLIWLGLAPNLWLAIPGILISGYSFTTGNTQISVRLQQLAPDEMRGRVLSANGMAFNGVMPFATILVSLLSQTVGQSYVMVACALLLIVATTWLWRRYVWQAFVPPPSVVVTA